jgi:hypothetical protein
LNLALTKQFDSPLPQMTYRIGVGSLAPVTLVSVLEHPIDDSITARISKFFIFLTYQRLPGFFILARTDLAARAASFRSFFSRFADPAGRA